MDIFPIQTISPVGLLAELERAPRQLYVQGNLSLLEKKDSHFLTIIGTRKISDYGKQVCREILKGLQGYPFVVISGLALGTDSLVHELCIQYNIPTIAVVGSGLEKSVLYPQSNLGLAKKILDSNGTLVSPFVPNFKAKPWSFPVRNAIMAGMAHAVIVIEAENKSGSRITARQATQNNREVFAVPGSIFNPFSCGTNHLIQEGAFPILSPIDVLDYFGYEQDDLQEIKIETLPKLEREIFVSLAYPQSRDELSKTFHHTPFSELLVALSNLEISGYVQETLGKFQRKI